MGVIRINQTKMLFGGDKTVAKDFIGQAKSQMEILIRTMSFQNLKQGIRRIQPYNNVSIECRKIFDYQECFIWVKPSLEKIESISCWWSGPWMEGKIVGRNVNGWATRTNEVFYDSGVGSNFRAIDSSAPSNDTSILDVPDEYLLEYYINKQYQVSSALTETVHINIDLPPSYWTSTFENQNTSIGTINKIGEFVETDGVYPYGGVDGASRYSVVVCKRGVLEQIDNVYSNNRAVYLPGQPVVLCRITPEDHGVEEEYYIITPFILSKDMAFPFAASYCADASVDPLTGVSDDYPYNEFMPVVHMKGGGDYGTGGIKIDPDVLSTYSISFNDIVNPEDITHDATEIKCQETPGGDIFTYPVLFHTERNYYDYIIREESVPVDKTVTDRFNGSAFNCLSLVRGEYCHYNKGSFFFPIQNDYVKYARHGTSSPHSFDGSNMTLYQPENEFKLLCAYDSADQTSGIVISKTDTNKVPVIETEWRDCLFIYIGYHQYSPLSIQEDFFPQEGDEDDVVAPYVVIWDTVLNEPANLLNAAGTENLTYPCKMTEAMHWLLAAKTKGTVYEDAGSGSTSFPSYPAAVDGNDIFCRWWSNIEQDWVDSQVTFTRNGGASSSNGSVYEETVPNLIPHWPDHDIYSLWKKVEDGMTWELTQNGSVVESGVRNGAFKAWWTYYPEKRKNTGSIDRFHANMAAAEDENKSFKASYVMLSTTSKNCLNTNLGPYAGPWYTTIGPQGEQPYVTQQELQWEEAGGVSLETISVQRSDGDGWYEYSELKAFLEITLNENFEVLSSRFNRDERTSMGIACWDITDNPPKISFALGHIPHNIPLKGDL